jgi:hypothetical protein
VPWAVDAATGMVPEDNLESTSEAAADIGSELLIAFSQLDIRKLRLDNLLAN